MFLECLFVPSSLPPAFVAVGSLEFFADLGWVMMSGNTLDGTRLGKARMEIALRGFDPRTFGL